MGFGVGVEVIEDGAVIALDDAQGLFVPDQRPVVFLYVVLGDLR
ncbi:MAG: hypothetical protein WAU71_05950 [Pyrinomonadaceae bacterium]